MERNIETIIMDQEEIFQEVSSMASDYLGKPLEYVKMLRLNSREKIHVCRVWFNDLEGNEITFIAKFLNEEIIDPERDRFELANFAEEIRNYEFLMTLRDKYPYFPMLCSQNSRIFILEDLGPRTYHFDDNESLFDAITECFVQLHSTTKGKRKFYEEFMPSTQAVEDKRVFSGDMQLKIFQMGRDIVADYLSILTPHSSQALISDTESVIEHIYNPDIFEAFIHDDLADGRQSVILDGVIHLLDFEHGKFGHSLMDLATILIGKMERDLDIDKLTYYNILLPTRLSNIYRSKLERLTNTRIDDDLWNKHLASCMIFQAFIVIKLCTYNSHKEFKDSLAMTVKMVLERLLKCLKDNPAYPELQLMLKDLTQKILVSV